MANKTTSKSEEAIALPKFPNLDRKTYFEEKEVVLVFPSRFRLSPHPESVAFSIAQNWRFSTRGLGFREFLVEKQATAAERWENVSVSKPRYIAYQWHTGKY